MHKKLIVKIDADVLLKAKTFAKKQGRSLSSLIENHLKMVTREEIGEAEISKKIEKLKGAIMVPLNFDYKTDIGKAIYEKHMQH